MSLENAEIYPPFAGVLLYFLRRELKRYEGGNLSYVINNSCDIYSIFVDGQS